MNQEAINQFKAKTNDLITILGLFLQWCNDVEAQDKLYVAKMQEVANNNKEIAKKQILGQEKEKELIRRELEAETALKNAGKLKAEYLSKIAKLQKDRDLLAQDRITLDKELKEFEVKKIDQEKLKEFEKKVVQREKLVEINEQLYEEKTKIFALKEKQLEARGKYLQDVISK